MHRGFALFKHIHILVVRLSVWVVQQHEQNRASARGCDIMKAKILMQSLSAVFTAYTFLHDETQAQTSPNPFARDHACVIASNHNPVNRLTFM